MGRAGTQLIRVTVYRSRGCTFIRAMESRTKQQHRVDMDTDVQTQGFHPEDEQRNIKNPCAMIYLSRSNHDSARSWWKFALRPSSRGREDMPLARVRSFVRAFRSNILSARRHVSDAQRMQRFILTESYWTLRTHSHRLVGLPSHLASSTFP